MRSQPRTGKARVPRGTVLDPETEAIVAKTAARYDCSKSWVVASAVQDTFGLVGARVPSDERAVAGADTAGAVVSCWNCGREPAALWCGACWRMGFYVVVLVQIGPVAWQALSELLGWRERVIPPF